jgi:hypothetical protein
VPESEGREHLGFLSAFPVHPVSSKDLCIGEIVGSPLKTLFLRGVIPND